MGVLRYGNRKIMYEVKRGRREKTVALQVQGDSAVVVLSPRFLSNEKIKEIVLKRARWIIQKQEWMRKLKAEIPEKEYVSGESFPYLGRQYRLKVIKSSTPKDARCKLLNGRFYIAVDSSFGKRKAAGVVRQKLIDWYMKRAEEKVRQRIERYSLQLGNRPKKVIIKNQEKRWGSCSHAGVIRLNWKIVMAPLSIFDYVIVHELCHLVHQNHSSEFWFKVESIITDYKRRRNWLKENGIMIM